MRCSFVRPFHKADGRCAEILFKAGFEKLIWMREPIEIKVIQRHSRNCINFEQGVGRAFYAALVPQRAQQTAGEGGFARAKVAFQPDHQPRLQGCGQRRTAGLGGGLVAQMAGER